MSQCQWCNPEVQRYIIYMPPKTLHYTDVIISTTVSQITGVSIVCSAVCSCGDQRKHEISATLVFVKGIHRWPVDSPRKGPVTRKMFLSDDVILNIAIMKQGTRAYMAGSPDVLQLYTETERSSGWQPWYPLETLKTSFKVSSQYQGCQPDDIPVSVYALFIFHSSWLFLFYLEDKIYRKSQGTLLAKRKYQPDSCSVP